MARRTAPTMPSSLMARILVPSARIFQTASLPRQRYGEQPGLWYLGADGPTPTTISWWLGTTVFGGELGSGTVAQVQYSLNKPAMDLATMFTMRTSTACLATLFRAIPTTSPWAMPTIAALPSLTRGTWFPVLPPANSQWAESIRAAAAMEAKPSRCMPALYRSPALWP